MSYPWAVYHKLMHRLARAAAAHPDQVDSLLEMADRLEELAKRVKLRFVQTHGQYRHTHVFLGDKAVTVIHLDGSRPADPAKDLGEFIHRMRSNRFKATSGLSRAEEATGAFIEEYASHLPQNLENLSFYWCYHTLASLWRFMSGSPSSDPRWQPMVSFYLSEFETARSEPQHG